MKSKRLFSNVLLYTCGLIPIFTDMPSHQAILLMLFEFIPGSGNELKK
jgi:hypothetical protein